MATNNSCDYVPTQFNVQSGGASGTLSNIAPSTAGFVLTSNGGAAQPTFQAGGGGGGGVTSIAGNAGGPISGAVTLTTSTLGGTSHFFTSGSNVIFEVTDTFSNALFASGFAFTSGGSSNNTAFGVGALSSIGSSGSSQNTAVGRSALGSTTGSSNIAVGYSSGSNYTGAEQANICIGATGSTGESNATRIGYLVGTSSTQTACFIDGISGATVVGAAVLCSTGGQLGTIVSSRKFKENIHNLTDQDSILELRPVSFSYKADKSNTISFGLIAEEVEAVFPELVLYDEYGDPSSVKYHELPALLLNEIQKLVKRVAELEQRISE